MVRNPRGDYYTRRAKRKILFSSKLNKIRKQREVNLKRYSNETSAIVARGYVQ